MTVPWSLVIPIRDEVELFKQTFPNCVALNPSEILLCLNEKYPSEIELFANKLCKNIPLRIVTIRDPDGWRFPQAHARVEGFKIAKYERILNIDVDNILYPSILKCLDFLGYNDVGLVTFRKDMSRHSFVSVLRGELQSLNHKFTTQYKHRISKPTMGAYWIYRPYYLDVMNFDEYKRVYNGSDTYLHWKFDMRPCKYKHIYLDEPCCRSLRNENEGLIWRQLEYGVYFACHKVSFNIVLRYAFINLRPLVVKGYYMGLKLPEYVRNFVAGLTYEEFLMFHDNERWLSC